MKNLNNFKKELTISKEELNLIGELLGNVIGVALGGKVYGNNNGTSTERFIALQKVKLRLEESREEKSAPIVLSDKTITIVYMTHNELNVLKEVNECWCPEEGGISEFTSEDVKSKSVAGTISSLLKKELIYDSYEDYEDEDSVWCMTQLGASVMVSEGHQYDCKPIDIEIEEVKVVIQ